jgi:hypothetical protein
MPEWRDSEMARCRNAKITAFQNVVTQEIAMISCKWSEKIGELMKQKEALVFDEMLSVPVINPCHETIGHGDALIL